MHWCKYGTPKVLIIIYIQTLDAREYLIKKKRVLNTEPDKKEGRGFAGVFFFK